MAALPDESTARLWIDYRAGGTPTVEHTVRLRYAGADRSAAAAQGRFLSFLQAITPGGLMVGWQCLRCRTALAGEAFSTDQALIGGLSSLVGQANVGATNQTQTYAWTWRGRGVNSPRRVALTVFGLWFGLYSTGLRWVAGGAGTPAVITAATNALQAASSPLVAIDGTEARWYSYVNCSSNGYWERRLRVS